MRKKILIISVECIVAFIMFFIFNSFFYNTHDHIWDFMHSSSISKGLSIYKDFNIVVGPIYPIFMAFFLRIFGNSLIVFDIVNSIIVVCIYLLIRINNKKTLALFALVICFNGLNAKYNVFTLLLFYIIYYLEKSNYKNKDYLIGIFLALLFFTKISVGGSLVLATIIINIKCIKSLLKRALSFSLISLIIIGMMLLFDVFSEFINYTVLGLFDFTGNKIITFYIVFEIIGIIYILLNIKKDKKLIYMLLYMTMSIPIFDQRHISIAVFPIFVYFLDSLKQNSYTRSIVNLVSIIVFIVICISVSHNYKENIFDIRKKCVNDNCFISNSYYSLFKIIHGININIKDKEKYRIFYINTDSYLYKYDLNENINKYDLLLRGNMGYNGEQTYINEIKDLCSREKCLFVLDNDKIRYNRQFPTRIRDFIIDEYEKRYEINYKQAIVYIYTN